MGMMGGCMAGMGLLGLLGLALLVGAIAGVVYLAGGFGRSGRPSRTIRGGADDRALTVLRERFARGKIDRAEYEERRATLAPGEAEWA